MLQQTTYTKASLHRDQMLRSRCGLHRFELQLYCLDFKQYSYSCSSNGCIRWANVQNLILLTTVYLCLICTFVHQWLWTHKYVGAALATYVNVAALATYVNVAALAHLLYVSTAVILRAITPLHER